MLPRFDRKPKGELDMPPKKGEPGYEEYREAYNARRRKRQEDPEYRERYRARKKASDRRVRARRRTEQLEIPYDEES